MNETLNKDLYILEEESAEYNLLSEGETTTTSEENILEDEETTTTSEIIIDNSDVVMQLQSINDTLGIILVVLLFFLFKNWINDIFSKIISCGK